LRGSQISQQHVRFADGKAHPEVRVDQDIRDGLPQLARALKTARRYCPPTDHMPRLVRTPRGQPRQAPPPGPAARSLVAADRGALRRAAFNWHAPTASDINVPACAHCADTCNNEDADCEIGAFVTVILSAGAGAAGVFTCHVEMAGCIATCYLRGHGCCPTDCNRGPTVAGGSCCGVNETCLLPGQQNCCPASQHVCRGTCCEQGVVGCAPDGFCGCDSGETPCGDDCCPATKQVGNTQVPQVCCGGGCCDAGKCQNGTCTSVPQAALCGGQPLGAFQNCCNGRACTGVCVGGQCCDGALVCGGACCAQGQFCIGGRCTGPIACPAGQSACDFVVPPGNDTTKLAQMCCPTGNGCCSGQCCPPGTECCTSGICRTSCIG
jgi:hypothetical protein